MKTQFGMEKEEKQRLGIQKIVVVADTPSAEMPPKERAAWIAAQATQHPSIR